MKFLRDLLLAVFAPIMVLLIPEIVEVDQVYEMLLTLGGSAGILTVIVEGIKNLLNYDSANDWKGFPKVLALFVGALFGIFLYWLEIGLFVIANAWYDGALIGLIVGGLSMDWYDTKFAKKLIKSFWGAW